MKRAALLILMSASLFAQSPKAEVLYLRTASLCGADGVECLTVASEVRMLKIAALDSKATAYQIQIVTPDKDGARRTWSYIVERSERRIGEFSANVSATLFAIPIDADIPILDVWVTALVASGEPSHQSPSSR